MDGHCMPAIAALMHSIAPQKLMSVVKDVDLVAMPTSIFLDVMMM